MKPFALLLVVFVATASSVQLPSCANTCIARAIQKSGCSSSNTHCICGSEHYLGYLRHCASKRCDKSDKRAAIESATELCSLVASEDSARPALQDVLNTQNLQKRNEKYEGPSRTEHGDWRSSYKWQNLKKPEQENPKHVVSAQASPHTDIGYQSYYTELPQPSFYTEPPQPSFYTNQPQPSFYTESSAPVHTVL